MHWYSCDAALGVESVCVWMWLKRLSTKHTFPWFLWYLKLTEKKKFGLWLVYSLYKWVKLQTQTEYKQIVSDSITNKETVVKGHSNEFLNFIIWDRLLFLFSSLPFFIDFLPSHSKVFVQYQRWQNSDIINHCVIGNMQELLWPICCIYKREE